MSKTSRNDETSKQAAMCCQWSSSHHQSHRLKPLCVARSHHPDTCNVSGTGENMSDIINSRQFLLECWTGRPGGLQHLHSAFHYLAPGVREVFLFMENWCSPAQQPSSVRHTSESAKASASSTTKSTFLFAQQTCTLTAG